MKSTETITRDVWRSSVHPEIVTHDPRLAEALEWADANPRVWKIVTGTKSAEFGKNGQHYYGYERGEANALSRAASFKNELERDGGLAGERGFGVNFFVWRAHFTLEHYEEKGFRGGFFQQFGGTYARGCAHLDYTPETLEAVIDRFLQWSDVGYKFPTREVWIDKRIARTVGGKLDEVEQRASEFARGIKKKERAR